MGAYKNMRILFPNLLGKARSYGYPESSVCILAGDEFRLKSEFPATFTNLKSCKHNRDRRSAIEYGQDLVASWVAEDYVMESLTSEGVDIHAAGADRFREVLPTSTVKSSSDCEVIYFGEKRPLELMNSYTTYWSEKYRLELRDNKYKEMRDSQSLLLGISFADMKYLLIDFAEEVKAEHIPSYNLYGGKPAYRINFSENGLSLKEMRFDSIALSIRDHFCD